MYSLNIILNAVRITLLIILLFISHIRFQNFYVKINPIIRYNRKNKKSFHNSTTKNYDHNSYPKAKSDFALNMHRNNFAEYSAPKKNDR